VDLGDRIGNLEVEQAGGLPQPLGMLGTLEDFAAIGPFALEHAACIMEPMGEHVQLGVLPGHELAVVPDDAVALVEWQGHDAPPGAFWPEAGAGAAFCLRAQVPIWFARSMKPRFARRRNGGATDRPGKILSQRRLYR